jgi:gas vesicle protein
MDNNFEEHASSLRNSRNVLISLLVGGLAGAVAMLLFAPQSGKRTRAQIQLKSIQLRDRTTDGVKNALAQVRFSTRGITAGVREKAGRVKHFGQDKLAKQIDRVSVALDAGKTAVEST